MRRDGPDAQEVLEAGPPWPTAWTEAGIIEVLEPLVGDERRRRLQEVIAQRIESVTVLLDGPYDPHNAAAVLRSCDAFGVHRLHAVSAEPLQTSRKVAQGAQRWVEVSRHATPTEAIATLNASGHCLVVAHPKGNLVPEDLARLPRVAIVLGNEHSGVSAEVTQAAQDTVRIPMQGFVESLNLSVSTALLLYAATRQRSADLNPTTQRISYARGLFHSVIRAEQILAASSPR
jgi:tRNA (guanosine-2'-O-)-methyltransferase